MRWWLRKRIVRRQLRRDIDAADKFTLIYRMNYWGNQESRSGNGSSLESTEVFRDEFESLLDGYRIRSVFDAPCGDWNWMRTVKFPAGMNYIGGDLVDELVKECQKTYGSPNIKFTQFDITRDPFPGVDLWLCRDCFIHLSNADIWRSLDGFLASNSSFALITSHPGIFRNADIRTGQYRDVNLLLPPFSFPKPELELSDVPHGEMPRILGLWRREHLLAIRRAQSQSSSPLI
jgi:hypothetical protein